MDNNNNNKNSQIYGNKIRYFCTGCGRIRKQQTILAPSLHCWIFFKWQSQPQTVVSSPPHSPAAPPPTASSPLAVYLLVYLLLIINHLTIRIKFRLKENLRNHLANPPSRYAKTLIPSTLLCLAMYQLFSSVESCWMLSIYVSTCVIYFVETKL